MPSARPGWGFLARSRGITIRRRELPPSCAHSLTIQGIPSEQRKSAARCNSRTESRPPAMRWKSQFCEWLADRDRLDKMQVVGLQPLLVLHGRDRAQPLVRWSIDCLKQTRWCPFAKGDSEWKRETHGGAIVGSSHVLSLALFCRRRHCSPRRLRLIAISPSPTRATPGRLSESIPARGRQRLSFRSPVRRGEARTT